MRDIMAALLEHTKDHNRDIELLRESINKIAMQIALERQRTDTTFATMRRELRDIRKKMLEPVQFKFSNFWNAAFLKIGLALGIVWASIQGKLPEESAQLLGQLIKGLLG